VDESNAKLLQARQIKDGKKRFHAVWSLCKGKTTCESSDDIENENDEKRQGHNGCGSKQPTIRREGLVLYYKFNEKSSEVCIIIDIFIIIIISFFFFFFF